MSFNNVRHKKPAVKIRFGIKITVLASVLGKLPVGEVLNGIKITVSVS
jgi:hypothetical protein